MTLKSVISTLNSQIYIERIMLLVNILISAVGIGLMFFNYEFGASPNNTDTNGYQKAIWIFYVFVCIILIGFHSYLICYFRKMASFFLETLRVNEGFNAQANSWLINILIFFIVIALFKQYIFGVVEESIIVLDSKDTIDETPIVLAFYYPAKVLDYFEQIAAFMIPMYVVSIFRYFAKDHYQQQEDDDGDAESEEIT